jgi:U3 small nucleolar RNA-associated protein 11
MRLFHGRNHKERSQLANRARLGVLEKHKDYVQRARDYHAKQNHLNRLRQKAVDRNKDEFYFSMVRQKTREGVHWKDRGNKSLPTDIVKVLKTQDENYVRTMRTSNQKVCFLLLDHTHLCSRPYSQKIVRLKAHLTALADLVKPLTEDEAYEQLNETELKTLSEAGIISSPSQISKTSAKHIIFVDNDEEGK